MKSFLTTMFIFVYSLSWGIVINDVPNTSHECLKHIGKVGNGSGVYLGNGYVLTAAHVGCLPFIINNVVYKPDYSSWTLLINENKTESDLGIFKIDIKDVKPFKVPIGLVNQSELIFTGFGLTQNKLPVTDNRFNITIGYETQIKRELRWGTNYLFTQLNQPLKTHLKHETYCFTTKFDRRSTEAQAVPGDSGSGIFQYNDIKKEYELVGCVLAASPIGTYIPFGSQTYIADLSKYKKQIEKILDK